MSRTLAIEQALMKLASDETLSNIFFQDNHKVKLIMSEDNREKSNHTDEVKSAGKEKEQR